MSTELNLIFVKCHSVISNFEPLTLYYGILQHTLRFFEQFRYGPHDTKHTSPFLVKFWAPHCGCVGYLDPPAKF